MGFYSIDQVLQEMGYFTKSRTKNYTNYSFFEEIKNQSVNPSSNNLHGGGLNNGGKKY